ncbi:MAG: hypothetical protein ABIR04_11260 [Cypionkella sp.]
MWAGGLAGAAGAGCLAPGQLPQKVMFADGDVMDQISREGDHLRATTHLSSGLTAHSDAIWGLYPASSDVDGMAMSYRWKRKQLPAPQDLALGKAVTQRATRMMEGGSANVQMTVKLIGQEDIEIHGGRYPVLHLAVQTKDAVGVRTVSEKWLDPDRLLVWASKHSVFSSKGALEGTFEARVVAVK